MNKATNTSPPKISIVTPSFNQAEFLEDAILSVISQSYPNLEYVVIDGGSTDGSVDIIRSYENHFVYWVSEADNGAYDALNKGFAHTTGEIMAYLNSDDKYAPWAFKIVADIFATFPEIEWLTTIYPLIWDAGGRAVFCTRFPGYNRQAFFRGANLPQMGWHAHSWIQQESTFWRRSLWDKAGAYIESSKRLAADFELWARFWQHGKLVGVATPLSGNRIHPKQKTANQMQEYLQEALGILAEYGGRPYGRLETIFRRQIGPYIPLFIRHLIPLGIVYDVRNISYDARKGQWRVNIGYII